jgi:PKD repeat protein
MLFFSCSEDDNSTESILIADFEAAILLGENQAIVTLTNLSQNATIYEWLFPNGNPESSIEESPTIAYTENGTYSITLEASNGSETEMKTIDITIDNIPDNGHIPYRYLENDGIFMYYETDNVEVYQSLIPDEFNMPSRMVVFAFFNDFYELDYGATPYKENAISILVEHEGEEFFHVVYMPVTDEHSMWAGIIGLGLPKTLGEINFYRNNPVYYGDAVNPLDGTMNMSVNTENYTIDDDAKQDMINLSLLRSLQIRNGNIIEIGKTGGNETSVIHIAEQFPNLVTLKFGEATISTNTDSIAFNHPLDLTPSNIIGGYYLKNTIPFGLTGNLF